MKTTKLEEIESNPDFWWLRFRYATRDGKKQEAEFALEKLHTLGIDIKQQPQTAEVKQ